jgi:hypothetical protein
MTSEHNLEAPPEANVEALKKMDAASVPVKNGFLSRTLSRFSRGSRKLEAQPDPQLHIAAEEVPGPYGSGELSLPKTIPLRDANSAPVATELLQSTSEPMFDPELLAELSEAQASSPAAATVAAAPAKRQSLFQRMTLTSDAGTETLPIRVIIGYFSDISEKDAKEYAQGIADKHCDQNSLVHYGAYQYRDGYVYEVHEGGSGRAFSPEILKHFESRGPLLPGEFRAVIVKTATRIVEVQQTRDGIAAIFLPESSNAEQASWLVPTKRMTPAMNRRTTFFKASAVVFATGIFGLIATGLLFRLQPIDFSAGPKPLVISASQLPRSQWSQLLNTPEGFYVRTLRFQDNKWMGPEYAPDTVTDSTSSNPLPAAGVSAETAGIPTIKGKQ